MKTSLSLMLVASVCPAFGYVNYYIKDGVRDWTSGGSYEGGKAPSAAGDRVMIRDGRTVYLDFADEASFALLKETPLSIYPMGSSSRIFVDVPEETDERVLSFEITSHTGEYAATNGVIVKTGLGKLTLANDGDAYRFASGIEIRGGKVVATCTAGLKPNYGHVAVSNDASFCLPAGCSYCLLAGLWGEERGLVTTVPGQTTTMRVGLADYDAAGQYSRFGGIMDRGVFYFSAGCCELVGTNSVTTSPVTTYSANENLNKKAITGVLRFGKKADAASSVGTYQWIETGDNGGGFRYLGKGERTDKTLYMKADIGAYSTLDGGPFGLLDWGGKIGTRTTSSTQMGRFCLAGENALGACILSGDLSELSWTKNGIPYAFHVHKIGSGAWRFADTANNAVFRTWNGGLTVREGTIQFDSLDNRGTCCSLGIATNLNDGTYAGAYDPSHVVDYSFTLGDVGTEGALEFVGSGSVTNGAWSEDRRAVLNGDGRFKNDQTNPFRFKGVRSLSSAAKTLTLDGTSTAENTLADVTDDGAGAISLVKKGSGTWTLTGTNDFRGSLSVNAGTLVVANVATNAFSWFRWTIRQTTSGSKALCNCQEFALYDADGKRINNALNVCSNYAALAVGEVAYQRRGKYWENEGIPAPYSARPDWHHLGRLFDNQINYMSERPDDSGEYRRGWRVGWRNATDTGDVMIAPTVPSSWVSVVFRLDPSVGEAMRYDMAFGNLSGERPASYTIEGSADGLHWKEIESTNGVDCISRAAFEWLFEPGVSQNDAGTPAKRKGKGKLISGRDANAVWPMLENVSSVSVAAGAVLRAKGDVTLSKLTVDATGGMGVVDGFRIAESGILSVTGFPKDTAQMTLPGTYENVGGLENVVNWALSINGRSSTKQIGVRDGKITISSRGLVIMVR